MTLRTVPGHICNMLCEGPVHVDRAWSELNADERTIAANWQHAYEVDVVMVRQVEPMPPGEMPEGQGIVYVTGSKAMGKWDAVQTWGVWWEETDKPDPPQRRWAISAKFAGVCKRTGQQYSRGARIVKGKNGWELA